MTTAGILRRACTAGALLGVAAALTACDDPTAGKATGSPTAEGPASSDAPEACGGEPPATGTVDKPERAAYRTGSFAAEVELSDGSTRCVTSEVVTDSGFDLSSYHVEIGDFEDARLTIDHLDEPANPIAAGEVSPVVRIDLDGRSYLQGFEREECEVTLLSFTADETSGTFVCEDLGEFAGEADDDFLDAVPGGSLPRATGWWVAAR